MSTSHPESKPSNSLESGVIPHRRRRRRRTTSFIVLLIAVVLLGNAVVGENGLIALHRANRELVATFAVIEALRSVLTRSRDALHQYQSATMAHVAGFEWANLAPTYDALIDDLIECRQ